MIAVVIDFSERVEKFIENDLSAYKVINEYYLNFIPWINAILWPLFALMAVVFFTSRLAKNSEIIASLSAGVSYMRLMRPYLITAFVLAAIHFVGNHIFVPMGNKEFINFDNTYIHPNNEKTKTQNIHIFLDPESKIYIRSYRKHDTSARGIFLERFDGNQLRYFLKAESIKWIGRPDKWKIKDYEIRTFHDTKESLVIGKGLELDTSINLVPEDFVRYSNQREMMTTSELREFIAYENAKGLDTAKKMLVELNRRTADPFTIIILTIIGMAVASRKVRGGMGIHLALGITIGALYIILSRFSITFANKLDLPAGFSVWIPNIIFSVVALFLVLRAQK
jgi:lipopolysaccharide export system permease protein